MAAAVSPNWLMLKKKLESQKPRYQRKRQANIPEADAAVVDSKDLSANTIVPRLTRTVAIDCEMVGTGITGSSSMLARVSVVNERGECLYDSFVKPKDYVTDLRTPVSGVRFKDILTGKELSVVQKEVFELINGRIVVGHALRNDFRALLVSHPKRDMRDTSRYRPFRKLTNGRTPGLKTLSKLLLGKTIQEGEHSSVEDARAAMQIYTLHKREWEESVRAAVVNKRQLQGKTGNVPRRLKPKKAKKSTD